MSDQFNEIIGHYFTKEEWALWAKGEFNLFDNYVERVGMSDADADRLRKAFRTPTKGEPSKMTPYQEFLKKPLDMRALLAYDNKDNQ